MIQKHNCAHLQDGFVCDGDEHCQYKLVALAGIPGGMVFCGKDQILKLQEAEK